MHVTVSGLVAASLLLLLPVDTDAQVLGTFRWQLQPFCNVLTLVVSRVGGVFTLDGTDDQCGGEPSAVLGVATIRPAGTVSIAMQIVERNGFIRGVFGALTVPTLGGDWRDNAGNYGDLTFTPGASNGGNRLTLVRAALARDGAGTALSPAGLAAGDGSVTTGGTASGRYSASFGLFTAATGSESLAAGYLTKSQGTYSAAFNNETSATGPASFSSGYKSLAQGSVSFAMGSFTRAAGDEGFAQGFSTSAEGARSIAGGANTTAVGVNSVAFGRESATGGAESFAFGYRTTAAADGSVALGRYARANGAGSFVFGDASTTTEVLANGSNRFVARAAGGVAFYTSPNPTDAPGVPGVKLSAGGSGWISLSDRNSKENFRPMDGERLLASLAGLSIHEWNYRSQAPSIRHLGPTAQDFRAAFGLGEDPLGINGIDADGVALAAAQALEARTRVEATAARERAEALLERIQALEQRLERLEGKASRRR